MATMTIAQALTSSATGIIIADTPANIGAALSNAALVARVSQFTMNSNGAAWASLATQLAGLGSKFSVNGFRLTVRDSVAFLSDPANAAGLGIATAIALYDTADNLLGTAGSPLALRAGSAVLSTSASLTRAQLDVLESETSFSVLPGQSITLADSAANLLGLTAAENRSAIRAFTLSVNSTVDLNGQAALVALPHFSIGSGATLTVGGSVATMTNPALTSTLAGFAATQNVVVSVIDSLAKLMTNAGAIATLAQHVTGLTTAMTDFLSLSAAQLTAASALPHFGVAAGGGIILSDTVANLLALSPSVAALAIMSNLTQSGSVTLAQLATLVALPQFDRAGHALTVTGSLTEFAAFTSAQQATVSGVIVRDSVAHLLAAAHMPNGMTDIIALLDGNTYTVAQATALLNLGGNLSLTASGSATALLISDTSANLTAATATLSALEAEGPVTVTSTDGSPLPGSVLTAAVAASLATSTTGLLVSDTGAALSAAAGHIFGRGFSSITVTSGVLAGTAAQLLDPTLHFGGQSSGTPSGTPSGIPGGNLVLLSALVPASAQLVGNTASTVPQLIAMSILPNFSLASGATLAVSDTIAALAGSAGLVGAYATSVLATDSETVTAAAATALAGIRSAIGAGNFSLGGHIATVSDDAANIANTANASGIALAGAVTLSVASIVTAAQAATLLGLGSVFSVNGLSLTIVDTAAHLATLTSSSTTLNNWGAQVQLSTDATLSVAGAQTLMGFTGFSVGSHHLTLSDTAANLLASGAAPAEVVASAVVLSQPATVTVASANVLFGLHGFSANGQAVTIADTPAHLVAMGTGTLAIGTTETIVARTDGNAADYILSAAQLAVLRAMSNLSMSGFANTITLSETAQVLAGLAPAFSAAPTGSLLTHVVPVLQADAVVTATTATTLANLPNFGLGGHGLTVLDTPANLVSSGVTAGIAIATSTGISGAAIVSVAMANSLAALHGFAAGGNPLSIADTPIALLSLSPSVAGLAANEQVVPYSNLNAAGFILTAAQLQTLAAIPNLTLAGPITVSDTAANLILLEAVFAAAAPGSAILAAAGASNAALSANATVSATSLHALAALPGFNLGGHSLTVSDTPSALLAAPPPDLGKATSVVLASAGAPWTVSAGAAEALVSLPHFGAGPGFIVSDSVGNLLAPANAGGLAGASSVTIGADVTVTAVQATALHGIAGFTPGTHHLTIANGAAGLVNLDSNTAAMATAIQLSGSGVLTVAQFQAIAALPNFSLNGSTLSVADTAAHLLTLTGSLSLIATTALTVAATVTADQAEALSALPRFSAAAGLTVADTAAHLLNAADAAGLALAGAVTLTADAIITTAQAMTLDQLGTRFSNGGHTLTIADTPTALAAGAGWGSIAGQISGYSLASHTGPWTISAAAATALESLPNFNAGPGFTVSDSVGNLLAPANATGLAGASSVVLAADATVAAWQADALHSIAGFGLASHQLTISDAVRGLANLSSGGAAMATAIQLAGNGLATVAQLHALQGLPHFSVNGNTVAVVDTAANLLTLNSGTIALASSIQLQGNVTLTADQAEALAVLPGFTVGTAHLAISDTVSNLLHITGTLPDNWSGELIASTITLTANATVTADQAEELATLGGRLVLGGHTLSVSDTAAHLLNAADAAGLALAASVTLSGPETGLSAAQATALAGIAHFNKGANAVTVSDTAANLAFAGNAAGVALADHMQLSTAASLSAASAEALIGLANFQTNGAAPLSIADSLAHLLQLGSVTLSHNNALLQPTSIGLSEDATATVAQMAALAALPEFAHFSLNGHALTVMDSGRHLASYTPAVGATPTAIQMIGDATLTAAQANAIAALGANITDNLLTVSDTPAALLNGGNTSGIALATALTLSGNATTTAAGAVSLFGNPLFSTGGHHLTIQGSAAALLGLSSGIDTDATTLALTANETVSVATLLGLTAFGSKFSLNGHTLTVADTAAHLATLNPLETNLEAHEVLNASASVNAATAEALAALPHFARGSGITLTVTDSVAALSALSGAAQAIATGERLAPSTVVTLSVAQAQGLSALNAFSNSGATIVVSDTIAHLGTAGWQSVATSYDVTDSVANIVANAPASLLTNAASVVLAGDTIVDTTSIDTLAGIVNFTRGAATLTIADSPDAIAAHAARILAVASGARIVSSTAIAATQAEDLVGLHSTGKLTFAGSNHLVVADSYAHLSDSANAAGVALASVIDVSDTGAHLVSAASHDWGSATVLYVLTANGTVTGTQATVLAGLSVHYSNGGFTLTMADSATGVVANAAALTALGILAAVTDDIASIDAHAGALAALGLRLASVTSNDSVAVSADAAAGLRLLASVLAGPPVAVSDSTTAVVADNADLLALGAHLGTVTLTDVSPVTVALATGLLPLLAHLAGGTSIRVSDTGAHIAAQATGLASLGAKLGTVTLADGTATDAATAAALVPVLSHLGTQTLSVSDTAAAIEAAHTGLATMEAGSRIASIDAPHETVAQILTHGSALAGLNATASISDTAAHVNAALDGLQPLHTVVTAIVLTDGGSPTLTVTVAQLASDHGTLSAIASSHHVVVSDTAAHIQADLTGSSSTILGALGGLTGIVASDAGTVTLTETQLRTTGVDDGAGSAMALFSGGTLVATHVAAADAGLIAGLGVPPASMSIFDTAAHIQADLASGSSELVAERALISAITVGDSGTITLTEAQVTAAHVDDGSGSVFAKLTGGSLHVTGVTVAQIDAVTSLPVAPAAIAIDDTAAHVQADLIAGSSHILGHLGAISAIAVNDAGTISLTVAQIEAAGVDDGAGSALSKTTGETLIVTGVKVADIATIASLDVPPASFAIGDTAAHIQADLRAGGSSSILAYRSSVSTIAVNPAGSITLSESQAMHAGVDDGAGSALSLMTGETLIVTGVAVADIGIVLSLGVAPDHITVDDTAAHIQADLASGASALAGNIASISSISVSGGGTITLTVGQIEAAGVDDGAGSVLAKMSGATLHASDAAVSDIGTLLALGVAPASIAIVDSAADVDADLVSGSSAILAHIGSLGSIGLTDSGTPALDFTLARLAASATGLSLITTPYTLAISDTAAHLQADLVSGSPALLAHRTAISSIAASDAGTITLTQAQVLAAHVDDGAGSVFLHLSGGTLDVTHVDIAHIGTVLGLGFAPSSIAVGDTAAHVRADLVAGSSTILANLGSISAIAVNDAGTIGLTDAQIQAAGVDDGAGSALSKISGATIVAIDVPIADIATMLALGVPPTSIAVSDTATAIEADLTGGSSVLLAHRTTISAILVNDSGTISLTVAQAEAAHVDDGAGSVFSKMTGETLVVTGALVSDVGNLGALIVAPTGLSISDTAAHIQADLASGSSHLAANTGIIGSIAVSDAGTITLTETQLRAAHVDDGPGSVMALASGGSLAVTHVLTADIGTIGALTVAPDSYAITDTAAHLQADLTSGTSALLAYLGAITSITVNPAGTITLTEAQVLAASVDDFGGAALAKMAGLTLHVTDVPVADIGIILALGVAPASITVSDTAANIQSDLTGGTSSLAANLAAIGSIVVSDAGEIAMTVAQIETAHIDDGAGSVFDKVSGGSLVITDALVSDISTLSGLSFRPNAVEVSDTAAHIQADLVAGGGSRIVSHQGLISAITVSDAGTITLTESQIRSSGVDDGLHAALVKTTGATIAVTQVLAADVGLVAALPAAPDSIAVRDTAAHIQSDLASGSSHILANIGLIAGIAVNPAGTITLTESQIMAAHVDDGAGSALSLMTGQTLTVTHVLVADVGTVAALGVPPDHIQVTDTAAHVQADLTSGSSNILANIGNIASIQVSPSGTITLTDAQVQASGVDDGGGSAMALMTGASLNVTGVPVADISTIMGLGVPPAHITVLDSEANIVADLTGGSSVIAANSSSITSVTPSDTSLDVADATALYNGLLGIATLNESGLTITGTAAGLLTAYSGVPTMLSAAHTVTMDGNPTGLTAAQVTTLSGILGGLLAGGQTLQIVDTATHLLAAGNAAGIAMATDVELDSGILTTAAVATALAGLHAFNAAAQSILIQDTVAHLVDPSNAAGIAIATRVVPPSDVTVTAAQLATLSAIATFDTNGHAITVTGNAADIAALSQPALNLTSLAAVTDTSADVSASLNALRSAVTGHSHALSIALTDGVTNAISITATAATYSSDHAVMDAINTNGVVRVIGTAAQLAALSSTLAADAVVGQVAVSDTAANILANLTTLNAVGAKFDSATISDATVSATLVSGLLTIPNLNAGSLTISDTGAQLAAAVQASGAPGLAFLNAHTMTLSADSVVTASQALSLQTLTSLNKNGHTLVAWDTASHLIDSVDGYLAAVSTGSIDGVYLKTVGGTATVSAATAAALFSIPNFSKNNPDSSSNVLTVSDTAAHLESSFTALNAHKTAVSGIVVSASSTVTDAVYGDMLTLGATTAFGVNMTVRDTAANIVAHAPTQLSGSPSITPATWALSGSATVSIANAAYLGGLSGFSPGAFTLTLGADGSASVTDANNLGALGSTLHLGGHHVHVAGSVATVSGLTAGGKAIATPDITDTFAHIATLAIGGGLLGGTIAVTDSGAPTVAQANAFLAILLAGGNGGIPIGNMSFGGHTEAITDTLANIQTLTGSAGWTSNASVHTDFSLVVADTVATLINGANTAALSAMAGTTLSGNQTTTAANAESLFALEGTINFTLGGHTIAIQDTAANILNLANADGEALATAWRLSGNDTVTAADAETLLTASKFSVNGHTLTISDSSDNLLDGVLGGDVSGFSGASHVHVQLAGAETLDAQTAAALVALPGFTNNGNLSIQDSSDYLLRSANHTAEADAASVTLVGDETVSVSTAVSLAAVSNFTLGSNHLLLASNDYANAAALVAIGNFDTGFDANGHTLTMTQDALNLTPSEYNALQSDNIVLNGHALSALATGIVVTSGAGTVQVSGDGIDGATLNVYASSGASLSHTTGAGASFTATASEGSIGNGVVVTETVGASAATSESAPIIALEQTIITAAATGAGATFAGSGSVQVGGGAYLNLYTTANEPGAPANPNLVYDATAHTLSLDIAGHAPLVLVTLGSATHPASLDPSEIVIQHFT